MASLRVDLERVDGELHISCVYCGYRWTTWSSDANGPAGTVLIYLALEHVC